MRIETIIFDREVPQCPRSIAVTMTVAEVETLSQGFPPLSGCIDGDGDLMDVEREDHDELFLVLSISEAASLTRYCGRLSPRAAGDAYPVTTAAWSLLNGMVFNRYWDDGLDGYEQGERE